MKYVDEWNLNERSKKEVKRQLETWSKTFKERANNQTGIIKKADFKNNKLLFMTRCVDITTDESLLEPEKEIKRGTRKRNILLQLFINELITGESITNLSKCGQCGNILEQEVLGDIGNIKFCEQCYMVHLTTDMNNVSLAIELSNRILESRGLSL